MVNTNLKKIRKAQISSYGEIIALIIVLILVIVFMLFLFSSSFSSYLTNWFQNLPGYHANTQTQTGPSDISNVQLPAQATSERCDNIVGGIISYSPDINYGINFVSKYNNFCITYTAGNCEFNGIYLNDPDGNKELKYYNKDLNIDEVIGHIVNNVIVLDSKVFDLNSAFNENLRIQTLTYTLKNPVDLSKLRQGFLYLDGSKLASLNLWLCKTKDQFNNQINDANGQAKFKLSWPQSEGLTLISPPKEQLNPVKSSGLFWLSTHYTISLEPPLNFQNKDFDSLYLIASPSTLGSYDIYSKFNLWPDKRVGLVFSDGSVWFTGDFIRKYKVENSLIKANFGQAVRIINTKPGANLFGTYDKPVIYFTDLTENDFYELNLRISNILNNLN